MGRRILDDWIESYVEYTSNTEPRETYRRWAAISTVAAVLQRKCFLPLGMETFYPNLYIVLVGPPAARKGTAMRPAREMLDALGISLAADESSRQKLIGRLRDADAMHTDSEGFTHLHSSLTIFSTELTSFIGYQNLELLTTLCKWHDCESRFLYETYARGKEEILNVWVNLFGATTPTLLQSSMPVDAVGSGFVSRTVFVFEEDKEKVVVLPVLSEAQEKLEEALITDLGRIHTLCGRFMYGDEFMNEYGKWRVESEKSPPFQEPRLDYYLQRRQVHLLKVCMIYSASRGDSMRLEVEDLHRTIATLTQAEIKMPNTFRGVGANPLAGVQLQVMKVIGSKKSTTMGELLNIFYNDVTKDQLAAIVASLEEMKFCWMDIVKGTIHYIPEDSSKGESF